MYSVVEVYGRRQMRAPDQNVYQLASLIEDDQGVRFLLCEHSISYGALTGAVAAGAQGLLRVTSTGFSFVTMDHFVTQRTENTVVQSYEMSDHHWLPIERERWGQPVTALIGMWSERFAVGDDPFVQVHTHTEFSAFDGYETMDELGQRMTELGQKSVGITDHGVCAGHPAARKMADEYGLHVIYGMEAYFVDDRFDREANQYDYWHLVLWAQDDEGLKNLWGASTEAYRDGLRGRAARLDWATLAKFNRGLMASTACLGGPLLDPYLKGDSEKALHNLARLGDLFDDRLYLELHTNRLPDQVRGNQWLVDVAAKTGVPLVAAVDAHYARKDQKGDHKKWLAMQTNRDVGDDTELFSGETDYHLHSIHEVRDALNYLPDDVVEKAIAQTGAIAERCTAEIKPKLVQPVFSRATAQHPDPKAHDVERFLKEISDGLERRFAENGIVTAEQAAPYLEKIDYEIPLLLSKGFPGYFLITQEEVVWAKDDGNTQVSQNGPMIVGPGRGSGGASISAWAMRITELDPVKGNLLIDRFITPGRVSLPDFDLDFPSRRQEDCVVHAQERWGPEHVARVGSHMRIKNKSAFKDTQRAIASELPENSFAWTEAISKLIKQAEASTAGLGLSWDDLNEAIGEQLDNFREKMPELFRLAEQFHLRLKTYGKHAAGIIIDPDNNLEDELPMRRGDEKDDGTAPMVTQFDMDALEYLGKVKFDFLSIRNLDTIQDTVDLIRTETGREIKLYEWTDEYLDPEVFSALADGWTLGVFQIETPLGTRITRQLKPKDRDDLTNIVTICRPGPLRSGLDKVYMRRRDGIEKIIHPDPRLEEVLKDTYGVMLYQEDIMNICKVLAGYTSDEADVVRKILGKKQVEKVAAEGVKFIDRAVANGTDRQVAIDLWAQMAEFAKYSFNRAHAYAYATIACWTAWFKVHWSRQSLTASMATIKKERIPKFVSEARRLGYKVLPPDINISGNGFTAEGIEIRYGLQSIPGIADAGATAIMDPRTTPYLGYDDFLERRGSGADMGVVKKLVAIGAFDTLHPNRRALEAKVLNKTSGDADRCKLWDPDFRNKYNDLPCHFDWDSEPKNYGRPDKKTGERKLLKNQSVPPTTCRRKACRQYVEKPEETFDHLPNFSDEEIRDREVKTLGVFLTSSPFDAVPDEVQVDFYTADELAVAENGVYAVLAVILSTRPDPRGRDFGFISVLTPSGEMSAILWRREWDLLKPVMTKGSLGILRVIKTDDDRFRVDIFEKLT